VITSKNNIIVIYHTELYTTSPFLVEKKTKGKEKRKIKLFDRPRKPIIFK